MFLRMLPYALAIFAIDRLTKLWIVEGMDLRTVGYIEVWPPFLNLTMAWNEGINFGLFNFGESGRYVLIAVALLICVGVLYWARAKQEFLIVLAVGFVVGGAVGNIWDRFQYGAVADFLNMSCCGIRNPFAFNVADVAIFAGAAMLILWGDRDTHA